MIYLSGPMSGFPERNYPAFHAAANALRAAGFQILSPHEDTLCVAGLPWVYYLRHGLVSMLEQCNAIALLPGWESSKGAKLELMVAEALEFIIYDVVDNTLVPR